MVKRFKKGVFAVDNLGSALLALLAFIVVIAVIAVLWVKWDVISDYINSLFSLKK
ncbi:hypothetical protein J4466_02380 [Candidatus Pacearchaeota archaeon]|nr:hypothetical protein [Candidatus Pacearchaeota archaeon]